MFAAAFGLGLGTLIGLSAGPFAFKKYSVPKDYSFLDEAADKDDSIMAPPLGSEVGEEIRDLLKYTEPWATWPDYQRVSMINRITKGLWPSLSRSIMAEVIIQVKSQLDSTVFGKIAFIEDIVFGKVSLRNSPASFEKALDGMKAFSCGTNPLRLGGFKPYLTGEDEVILEVPVLWGSDSVFDVGVFVRVGPFRFYVPVRLKNIAIKAETRVTLKPLTDIIPCFGGLNLSLLELPIIDFSLEIAHGVDLMSIPIIKEIVGWAVKYVLNGMMVYPNSMSVPLLSNYGVPPPVRGALCVTLLKVDGVKAGNMYFSLEVRTCREVKSQKVKAKKISGSTSGGNGAVFGEEYNFVVDNFEDQKLKLVLWFDDLTFTDKVIGIGEVPFGTKAYNTPIPGMSEEEIEKLKDSFDFTVADFIKAPMTEKNISVKLFPPSKVLKKIIAKGGSTAAQYIDTENADLEKTQGSALVKVMFIPFFQPSFDDEEELTEAEKERTKRLADSVIPTTRSVMTNITDKLKGVLTIKLIRCLNLNPDVPNFYVKMTVVDDDSEVTQSSSVIMNEVSPRWGSLFDFVMITAGSMLHITVYSQRQRSAFTKVITPSNMTEDLPVGKLQIPVKDVVASASLKDVFTLTDTEQGSIELSLKWYTCFVSDD